MAAHHSEAFPPSDLLTEPSPAGEQYGRLTGADIFSHWHDPASWEVLPLGNNEIAQGGPIAPEIPNLNWAISTPSLFSESSRNADTPLYGTRSESHTYQAAQAAPSQSTTSPLSTEAVMTRQGPCSQNNKGNIRIYRPGSIALEVPPRLLRLFFLSLSIQTQKTLARQARTGDFSFIDFLQSAPELETCHEYDSTSGIGSFTPFIQRLLEPNSFNPYRNMLQMSRFSFFAAFFANFSSLGFDFSLFLDENSLSPICGQDFKPENGDIPTSLRPLPIQSTIPHHPYIDSLPFPTFRQRALMALSTTPPLLDEDDLCHDLMLNDGLVCWGSSNSSSRSSGTPWDDHSWEAKGWFLRKWHWLVGGPSGELWRSSQWWASQRGEKLLLEH